MAAVLTVIQKQVTVTPHERMIDLTWGWGWGWPKRHKRITKLYKIDTRSLKREFDNGGIPERMRVSVTIRGDVEIGIG